MKKDFSFNRNRREGGFTLIEMMIVMAVLVVLFGIGIGIARSMETQAKITDARAFFERTLPTALSACHLKTRNYANCTQTAGSSTSVTAKDGLEIQTAWDQNWSSTYNSGSRTFVISYPAPDAETADALELALNSIRDESAHVTAVGRSGTTFSVTIQTR